MGYEIDKLKSNCVFNWVRDNKQEAFESYIQYDPEFHVLVSALESTKRLSEQHFQDVNINALYDELEIPYDTLDGHRNRYRQEILPIIRNKVISKLVKTYNTMWDESHGRLKTGELKPEQKESAPAARVNPPPTPKDHVAGPEEMAKSLSAQLPDRPQGLIDDNASHASTETANTSRMSAQLVSPGSLQPRPFQTRSKTAMAYASILVTHTARKTAGQSTAQTPSQ